MAGAQFAERVEGIISRLGSRFGTGDELTGVLLKPGATTGPAWNPTIGKPTEHEFVAVWGQFTTMERASGRIADGEQKLEVGATTLDATPVVGERVRVDSQEYEIKEVMPVRPGGVVILWTLRVAS